MGRRTLGLWIVVLAFVVGAPSLSAQGVKVGAQASFADDADFGIGPRLQIELPRVASGLWIASSFDYFFPDQGFGTSVDDVDYWEFNANLLYDIALANVTNLVPYIGAGLNVARVSTTVGSESASNTDLGLNIVGGASFPLASVTPFVEVRIEVEGGEQFVVAGGILFP